MWRKGVKLEGITRDKVVEVYREHGSKDQGALCAFQVQVDSSIVHAPCCSDYSCCADNAHCTEQEVLVTFGFP